MHFRDMRQVAPFESGHRILDEKRAGFLFPKLFLHEIKRSSESKGPPAHIVSIAGHEMNQSIGYPAPRVLLRALTKAPRQRASRHLDEATKPHPLRKPLRLRA